ncbi:hypothetical protein ACOMHN_064178 [Nucella lapillus]
MMWEVKTMMWEVKTMMWEVKTMMWEVKTMMWEVKTMMWEVKTMMGGEDNDVGGEDNDVGGEDNDVGGEDNDVGGVGLTRQLVDASSPTALTSHTPSGPARDSGRLPPLKAASSRGRPVPYVIRTRLPGGGGSGRGQPTGGQTLIPPIQHFIPIAFIRNAGDGPLCRPHPALSLSNAIFRPGPWRRFTPPSPKSSPGRLPKGSNH